MEDRMPYITNQAKDISPRHIELTSAQIAQLRPMFDELVSLLRSGSSGAILAQPDRIGYMKVVLVNQEQGEAIQKIVGLPSEFVAKNKEQLGIARRQLLASDQ